MRNDLDKAIAFAIIMAILVIGCLVVALLNIDWSGPILTERNPNGTIDAWYLFDNAYDG